MRTFLLVWMIAALHGAVPALAEEPLQALEDSVKEVMKITDQGLIPPVLIFDKLDSSVFFVNATADSLVSVKVNFGSNEAHCASPNVKLDSGVMRSTRPIGPKDFALMCFPSAGSYDVTVEGVGKRSAITGKIVVQ